MANASEAKAEKVWRGVDSAYSVFDKPIVQSAQDDRHYKLIKLANELQALLISDPTTDKAAASLNVGVGHLSDPDDRPGLAHFCEHLLFLVSHEACIFPAAQRHVAVLRILMFSPPPGHRAVSQRECLQRSNIIQVRCP